MTNKHKGVWCYKRRKTALHKVGYSDVLGCIALTGRVVEHGWGYRAERVTIRRLEVLKPKVEDATLRALETRYQCDVVKVDRPKSVSGSGSFFASMSKMILGQMQQQVMWGNSGGFLLWGDEPEKPTSNWITLPESKQWISVVQSESSTLNPSPIPPKSPTSGEPPFLNMKKSGLLWLPPMKPHITIRVI